MDQGFDESVIHLSGGMGQVGDITTYFKYDSSYYDPVLWHNGQKQAYSGYCSNIFAEEAIKFIEKNRSNPFFCYLSFNAPHTPLQVPDEYYLKYKDVDPTSGFERDDRPFPEMTEKDKEDARKVYAMVDNIDDNIGRLLNKLEALDISENTIVIFLTDNGPQQRRYIAGMRGRKGSVYKGGVRVPLYVKYPMMRNEPLEIETTAANIDILPTIAELCGAVVPTDRTIDGQSLVPLMENKEVDWVDRSLFFYWTRRFPELYNNMALQKGDFKLVGNCDHNASIDDFELYNIKDDPFELNNILESHKGFASNLKAEMDNTYIELINSENMLNPPNIVLGSAHENPLFLNRNDADGDRGIWSQEEIFGKWNVSIREGTYNFKFRFIEPVKGNGRMLLETGTLIHKVDHHERDADTIVMENVHLPDMNCELIPTYMVNGQKIFPFWVEVEKVG
jgi:arylsulfatase